jgi:N-acyl-D-aspartate/D-glutamate deacylase
MSDYDLIVRGGLVFDGTGAEPVTGDVGVRDGRVSAISEPALPGRAEREIDAAGKWVMPGLLDVHTHYDAEVLVSPGLGESVRHGVTTVLMGNCSLSTVYSGAEDCADLFSRVEALPWDAVHGAVKEHRDWRDPASYRAWLEARPLGANVAAMIGHSDMRVATMGLGRSVDGKLRPSAAELNRMRMMLTEALDAGFVGLSTIRSSFSKLDGTRYPARQLPSTYASWREYRALHAILRERGRVLQCTPNLTSRAEVLRFFEQSAGRWRGGRPMKTTLLSAADIKADPKLIWAITGITGKVNSLLGADFRWQHLPVPFEIYADGMDLVVFEEFGSGAAALNVRDELGRGRLVRDEEYRRWFRKDVAKRFGARVWHRDLYDAEILACPDDSAVGRSFGQIADERGIEPADALLDMVAEHGAKMRWRTTLANHRPEVLERIAGAPSVQMGFADSGAHLRNMAFYNFGLRLLRRVKQAADAGRPFLSTAAAVHRLTGELADWYGLDAGTLRLGGRADLAVIDPAGLDDPAFEEYREAALPEFGGLSRMVNRNDAAVAATVVGGVPVYSYGEFVPGFGSTVHAGRFLPAS